MGSAISDIGYTCPSTNRVELDNARLLSGWRFVIYRPAARMATAGSRSRQAGKTAYPSALLTMRATVAHAMLPLEATSCRRSREGLGARVSGSRAPRVGGVGQRTRRGAASPLCLVGRARGRRIDSRSPQVCARSRRRRRLACRTSRSTGRCSPDRDLAVGEDASEHAAGLAAVGGVGVSAFWAAQTL